MVRFKSRWHNERKLARFCTRIAGLLRSGLTLHTCLTLMYEQSSKQDQKTIAALLQGVEAGSQLSVLLHAQRFHPLLPSMVSVGEESGNMVHAFNRLGEHFAHRLEWKQKLAGSLIYPVIVSIVMVFATLFVLYAIMPRFETMYANLGFALPPQTSSLFAVTSALRDDLPWILLSFILLCSLLFIGRGVARSRYAWAASVILGIPVIKKIWGRWLSYRLSDSIAILMASGVPLLQTLETCERTSSLSLERKTIASVKERVLAGDTLTEALRNQYWIDRMLVHSVHAAEASGDLAGVCSFAAKEFEADLQRLIQRAVQLVEPLLILSLGVLIGFMVLAVIMPMMEMVQAI